MASLEEPRLWYASPLFGFNSIDALYAEIEVDYDNDTITLIRGHNYPNPLIRNGFDWKYDNSPLEYDLECIDWYFEEIPNGHMLSCYPFKLITYDENLLRMINEF